VRLAESGVPVPENMITADSVSEGKPNPAPYLAGARLLGLKPEECVVLEDSASGVKAGHAAGCIVVGTTFSHPIDSLEDADYLVTELTEISATVLSESSDLQLSFVPLSR
jgi:sugar-phosphatase